MKGKLYFLIIFIINFDRNNDSRNNILKYNPNPLSFWGNPGIANARHLMVLNLF
jgi:hypothetical protein